MRKLLALAVVCSAPALAQFDTFIINFEATNPSANTAVSVQLPPTGNHSSQIVEATVQCSAECNIRPERNGAGAVANGSTIVAITPVALDPESSASSPNLLAFSGAGIPVGTAVGPTAGWTIPAGGILPLGGGRNMSTGNGVGNKNYALRIVGSYAGTVKIYINVRVRR